MTPKKPGICAAVVVLLCAVVSALPVAATPTATLAEENLGPAGLSLNAMVGYQRATVEITGPRELSMTKTFGAGEAISVPLVDDGGQPLVDGRYKYVLRLAPRPKTGPFAQRGRFFIEDGQPVSQSTKRSQLADLRQSLNHERQMRTEQVNPTPQLTAYDVLTVEDYGADGTTQISLESNSGFDWDLYNFSGILELRGSALSYDGPALTFYQINPYPPYRYSNRLVVGDNGGDYRVYGTLTLASDYLPEIYFLDPDTSNFVEVEMNPAGDFSFKQAYGTTLFLDASYSAVGINTIYPGADLEIYDAYDFAAMRLNNATATFAFAVNPSGQFTVNKIGTGGQEFTVNERYDAGGIATMQVQGSLEATNVVFPSSRELKTNFMAVDGKEVLANLAKVPVMSWRFKSEDESVRHVGPLAEDFRQAFQLGDGEHISTIDAGGVTMAALQGLHAIVEEQQADLVKKDKELAALRSELAEIRRTVESMRDSPSL